MDQEISFEIILENSFKGVYYALQKGRGAKYEATQKQKGNVGELHFQFAVKLKGDRNDQPDFLGPYAQGPAQARFVYIDIGTSAGQAGSIWSRRIKIPLRGITWQMIDGVLSNSKLALHTKVNGIGKDGSPNCGTVKPFAGWMVTG